MATADQSAATAFPDPSRTRRVSIQIAEDLLQDRKPDLRYFTTRLNHKPILPSPQRRLSRVARPSSANNAPYRLTIEDDSRKYEYAGHTSSTSEDAFVLIYQPGSQDFLLRRVDAEYDFNLTQASPDADLPKQHRVIPGNHAEQTSATHGESEEVEDEDDLFENNPFSFLQYVDNIPQASPAVAASKPASRPTSLAGSPSVAPAKVVASKPHSTKPRTTKAPAAATSASALSKKAQKASTGARTRTEPEEDISDRRPQADTVKQPEVPTVHLERRASTRPNANDAAAFGEEVEHDFSVLDTERSPSPDKARHAAFRGTPKGMGPMSLSQLVRSPSSAGISPDNKRQTEATDDFELGGTDDESDDHGREDMDVNSINLGSPVAKLADELPAPAQQEHEEEEEEEQEEEDDDFDEDFDAALQDAIQSEQDDADEGPPAVSAGVSHEEDDESEEE